MVIILKAEVITTVRHRSVITHIVRHTNTQLPLVREIGRNTSVCLSDSLSRFRFLTDRKSKGPLSHSLSLFRNN